MAMPYGTALRLCLRASELPRGVKRFFDFAQNDKEWRKPVILSKSVRTHRRISKNSKKGTGVPMPYALIMLIAFF